MRKKNAPTEPCECCQGTGTQPDWRAIGADLRRQREAAGISLRRMAVLLEISPPFLVDLEHGRRGWSKDRETAFVDYCRQAKEPEA